MKYKILLLLICSHILGICQIKDNANNIIEAFNHAQQLAKEGNYSQAKEQYLVAYNLGDKVMSPVQLGHLYYSGLGVPLSITEAIKWYQISADNGHPEAAFYCGYAFHNGEGVPQDYSKALQYYYLASDTVSNANLLIGLLLRDGLGEQKNETKAYKYIKKAAEMGNPDAQFILAHGYLMGYGDLQIDKQAAKSWMIKSAQQGFIQAQIWLNNNQ